MKMGNWKNNTLIAAIALSAGMVAAPALAQDAPAREVVHVEAPEYPRGAERRNVEGFVVVSYSIDADGDVVDAAVAEAQPEGIFDRAALRAVESWRFVEAAAQTDGHSTRLNFELAD